MTVLVVLAYGIGATLGVLSARSSRLESSWRVIIRAQILLASVFVSLLAAWRLADIADLLWPVLAALLSVVVVITAWFVTPAGPDRPGRAALRGWSASPNGGFWVIPVATSVAGAPGAVVAVLADRVIVFMYSSLTWVLRRYAPRPQRVRTSWIDQAPLIALAIGLGLNAASDAPEWTGTALVWTAPLMALSGAAVFVGSALHPSQRLPWRSGMRVWLILTTVRLVIFITAAFFAPTPEVAIMLVLFAFSIPAFFPPQLSVLYGYADPVVATAARWGWIWAPVGITAALLIWRA